MGLYRPRRSRYHGGSYGSSSRCARPPSVGTPVVARRAGSDPVPTHPVRNRTDEQMEINRLATKRHENRTETKGIQRTRPLPDPMLRAVYEFDVDQQAYKTYQSSFTID